MNHHAESTPKEGSWRRKLGVVLATLGWTIVSFVLAYGLLWVVIQLVGVIAPSAFSIVSQNVYVVATSTLVYVLALAIMLWAPKLWKRALPSRKQLGLQRLVSWSDIGLSIPAMIVYFVLAMLVTYAAGFLPWVDMQQTQETGLNMFAPRGELMLIFMLLVVIGPVVEEVIFRGFMYGKLRQVGVPFWLTTLIVSVAFAAAHGQWNVAFDTFVLSVVMCVMREQTGAIWVGVLMHMMKNGIAFYFLFVNPGVLPAGFLL